MRISDGAIALEICVDTVGGAIAATSGGADRIELCSALEIGGLTPSAGLVSATVAAVRDSGVAVFAMVRPRSGDFTYDTGHLAVAIAEARALIAQGVDGLVFGAVRDGEVDYEASRRWIDEVRTAAGADFPCTFHRAIDIVHDPIGAVRTIADLGFDHILTSGGARRASDGSVTLRAMVTQARRTRTSIMAGAGITPDTVAALIADTGVQHVHASASSAMGALDPRIAELGFASRPARGTDVGIVRALRSALDMM